MKKILGILTIIVFCSTSMSAQDETIFVLSDGYYKLHIIIDGSSTKIPTIYADIEGRFEMSSHDENGTAVVYKGGVDGNQFMGGYSLSLNGKIYTSHIVGEVKGVSSAEGTIKNYVDGEKVKDGKWKLIGEKIDSISIESGEYSFQLIVPMFPPEKRDTTLPASVKVTGFIVSIDTIGMTGNKIKLTGDLVRGTVGMGITKVERGRLFSLQFVGNIITKNRLEGKIFFIAGDGRMFEGKWILSKKTKAK